MMITGKHKWEKEEMSVDHHKKGWSGNHFDIFTTTKENNHYKIVVEPNYTQSGSPEHDQTSVF